MRVKKKKKEGIFNLELAAHRCPLSWGQKRAACRVGKSVG